MIGRDVKIELFEVRVSKARKTAWSVKPVKIVDQKQCKIFALVFELLHNLSQCIGCVLVLILAKVDDILEVLWLWKLCSKSLVVETD